MINRAHSLVIHRVIQNCDLCMNQKNPGSGPMMADVDRTAAQFPRRQCVVQYRNIDLPGRYSIPMKETDPDLVKFEADLGWMVTGGADPLAISKSAPKRFPLLHFKDFAVLNPPVNTLGTDRQQQVVDLGQGLVPFKPIVAEAKKIGIEYYIVDHDPPFKNQTALEAAKIDFDYLSGILAS